ncbi:MAG: hypothetical protein LBR09_00005 [Endomicrobium sp.]|jgi:hypothetical protein|nr:hypothetical protein [Endomicrobium sp.]
MRKIMKGKFLAVSVCVLWLCPCCVWKLSGLMSESERAEYKNLQNWLADAIEEYAQRNSGLEVCIKWCEDQLRVFDPNNEFYWSKGKDERKLMDKLRIDIRTVKQMREEQREINEAQFKIYKKIQKLKLSEKNELQQLAEEVHKLAIKFNLLNKRANDIVQEIHAAENKLKANKRK